LSRRMTIRDVAKHLGVSWDVIKDIQKRDLTRRFSKPKLKHLRNIAIDEIAVAKGHRYLTVVMDLESGAVVFVGDGKGAKALEPFWKRLRGSKARIEAVAMDMSPAYRKAVSTHLPKAKIVFDRFHVMKLFNEKLSDLRCDLHREATDTLQKKVLKGTRWLLLKGAENLDEKRDEKKKLEEALALNKSLAVAYYLKEDLRQFWEQPGKKFASLFLDGWIKRAEASGIKALQEMGRTLAAHRSGLLNYYDAMITSGPMEGTNNKIKTMKRQAYGFRDQEFFKLKILAIHESRHELIG
jgi:transposase